MLTIYVETCCPNRIATLDMSRQNHMPAAWVNDAGMLHFEDGIKPPPGTASGRLCWGSGSVGFDCTVGQVMIRGLPEDHLLHPNTDASNNEQLLLIRYRCSCVPANVC